VKPLLAAAKTDPELKVAREAFWCRAGGEDAPKRACQDNEINDVWVLIVDPE
jgi:hypothetical protein